MSRVLADPLLGALLGKPPARLVPPPPPDPDLPRARTGCRPSLRARFLRSPRRWLRATELQLDARDPDVMHPLVRVCEALRQLEAAGVIESRKRKVGPGPERKEYRLRAGVQRAAPDLLMPTGRKPKPAP